MQIQLIRHATLILNTNNKKILVDPILSKKGTMSAIPSVPNSNANPLVELPVPVETLIDCDAVIVTHTHRDHFDEEAGKLLPKSLPVLCQPEDFDKFVKLGFTEVKPIVSSLEWEGINITRTKGRHGHGIIAGRMAPVSGFIISAPGEPVIYLTGDTVWYSCTEKAMKKFNPDVTICYCGEAKFKLGKPITMNAQDILEVSKTCPSTKIVAVHMEAWNHCRLSRKNLRDFTIENNIEKQVFIPENGEVLTF